MSLNPARQLPEFLLPDEPKTSPWSRGVSVTDEAGGRSLAAPGRDPVSFGTREPLEEMLCEPSLGDGCQGLILQSEKRGHSRCGKHCAEKWRHKRARCVQCGSVGCVSCPSERVCGVSHAPGRQSPGSQQNDLPQLWASGLSLWTAGWRGRQCCLRVKCGRVSEMRVWLVVRG